MRNIYLFIWLSRDLVAALGILTVSCGIFHCRTRTRWLWCRLSSPRPMMSTRNWTWVPCMARQILNHWTTRESPHMCFLSTSCLSSPKWNFCIPITWNQVMTWWFSLYPLQMQAFSTLSEDLCILPIQLVLFLFVLIPVAYLFYFFVKPQGMSDLSSLTMGWTCTPCIARVKS